MHIIYGIDIVLSDWLACIASTPTHIAIMEIVIQLNIALNNETFANHWSDLQKMFGDLTRSLEDTMQL